MNNDEATGLLKVVTDYAYALDILDKYDHPKLTIEGTTIEELFVIDYAEAKQAIHDLKEKFGGSSLLIVFMFFSYIDNMRKNISVVLPLYRRLKGCYYMD